MKGEINRVSYNITNPAPAAVDDLFVLQPGETVSLEPLTNDYDPDNEPLSLLAVEANQLSGVLQQQAQFLQYQSPEVSPQRGFERFSYTNTDGDDGNGKGWVTLVYAPPEERTLSFDGLDDFVLIKANDSPDLKDNFTIAAWIYLDGWGEHSTGFGRIFDKENVVFFPNGYDHSFYNDESLVCYFQLGNGEVTAVNSPRASLNLNTWHFVAVTFNLQSPQKIRLFIDGREQSVTVPIPGTAWPASAVESNLLDPVRIGESVNGNRAFEGRIAALYVSRAQTNPSENPSPSQLLAFWNFSEGRGSRTKDTVGLVEGQINGARWSVRDFPWQPVLDYFPLIRDNGDGWWQDPTLGWMRADDFPWTFLTGIGWSYFVGAGEGNFIFYPNSFSTGWLQGNPIHYPWLYSIARKGWIYHQPGSPWFYDPANAQWFEASKS